MALKIGSRSSPERGAKEGDSPVNETEIQLSGIQSTAGHEKPCRKIGGPSPKAKYDLMTDSVIVP